MLRAAMRTRVAQAVMVSFLSAVLCPVSPQASGRQQGSTAVGVSIVLPQKLVAGQPATLAVVGADGKLAAGAVVEFSGGVRVTTDETGRASFAVPEQLGVLTARLTDRRLPNLRDVSATVVPLPTNLPDGVVVHQAPQIVALHDRFTVSGSGFRGEADANQVTVGGQRAAVLGASPLELVLVPNPQTPLGLAQILVEVEGRTSAPVSLTLAAIEIASDKARLAPKEKGRLTVHVRGAWQRLDLEARNLTPDIVKLPLGDVQRLITTGGSESNTAEIELQGRRAGEFSVSVRLVPAVAGLPDTQAAIKQLLQSLRFAPQASIEPINRMIHRLERHPQDAPKVRSEIERLLADNPSGDFRKMLEAARDALSKR